MIFKIKQLSRNTIHKEYLRMKVELQIFVSKINVKFKEKSKNTEKQKNVQGKSLTK